MKHHTPHVLCALLTAAILCPAVCYASDEGATGEDVQPVFIPQLASPVPANFEDNEFIKVVTYFQKVTNYAIGVDWSELENMGVSKETSITFSLSNVPSGRAIELMIFVAAGNRSALLLDNGAKLHITTRRKAEHLIETDPVRWSYWRATPRPPADDQPSPTEIAVTKLSESIPWQFKDNKIENIFAYLRNAKDVNFLIDWRSLNKADIGFDTLVTTSGEPRPASDVLDIVLETVGGDLARRVDDFGIVIISTRDVIDQIFPAKDEAVDTEADGGE